MVAAWSIISRCYLSISISSLEEQKSCASSLILFSLASLVSGVLFLELSRFSY
jgi:hypothetical protein